jgi:hypothetical protein
MGIDTEKCQVCGSDLDAENCYYIYTGRLQQGVMSDKKSAAEYTLCGTCYNQIYAELMVSIQRRKARK